MIQIVYDIYFSTVYILLKIKAVLEQPGWWISLSNAKKMAECLFSLEFREDLDEVQIFQDYCLMLCK